MGKRIFDVIIIGGGISGLYCAYLLKVSKVSKSLMILEKENYVGGRIKTLKYKNKLLDVGAQYISENVIKLLQRKRFPIKFKIIREPSTVLFFGDKKIIWKNNLKVLLDLPLSIKAKIFLLRDIQRLMLLGNKYDIEIEKFVSRSTINLLRPFVTGITSEKIENFSTSYISFLLKNVYQRAYYSPSKFILHLCNFLKKEIIKNAEVVKIKDAGEYFNVFYKNRKILKKVKAKKIIFSVPPDELINKFSELLTKRKIKSLKEVKYSSGIVVSIKINRKLPYFAYFFDEKPVYVMTNFSDKKIVNLFIPGFFYKDMINKGDEKIKKCIITILKSHKYLRCIMPENSIKKIVGITKWKKYLPIWKEGYGKIINSLKENINGRIFFCGDYTDMPSIDGAIKSSMCVFDQMINA